MSRAKMNPETEGQDRDVPVAQELDATGLKCPLPVLKAQKRLSALADGELLRLYADDPAAPIDVMHLCAEQGHKLVRERNGTAGIWVFDIRKGG